jgi:hypothetical protein
MKSYWCRKIEQRAFFSCVLCVVQQLASRLCLFNSKGSKIMHALEISAGSIAYLDTLVKFTLLVNYPLRIARPLIFLRTSLRS